MANARKTAINILLKIENDKAYSNITVDKILRESELSEQDKAFVTKLVYGVLEKKLTLQYIVNSYSKTPIGKLRPFILVSLETALYQILFMDKIPDSAAVNETVKIVRNSKFRSLSGFVNAVLRSFLRDEKKINYPEDNKEFLSVKYNLDISLVELFLEQYGEETEEILKGFENLDYLSLKVNTLKISVDDLEKELSKTCEVSRHKLCDEVLLLKGQGAVRSLFGFDKGYFHIQDPASAICAKIVANLDGERVLDLCAAPGGKSFSIAEYSGDKGEILSLDLYLKKIELIKSGAKRLGILSINSFVNNAENYNSDLGTFNKVLCDLPCSGLGILGKKPEIRYKNVAFLDNLSNLQYHYLDTSKVYVNSGGFLIFSTCTLNKNENQKVAEKFLENNRNFEPFEIGEGIVKHKSDKSNTLTLFPHIHNTDGFFISVFKRVR